MEREVARQLAIEDLNEVERRVNGRTCSFSSGGFSNISGVGSGADCIEMNIGIKCGNAKSSGRS